MTETPLEDREKILKRHGWTHCEADTPYHDIWTNFWGITPRKRFQKVQGWPEWVEALEPDNLDLEGELGELAEDHELYPEDIAEVGFYDLGDICPLRPTRGRITLVSQHKTLLTELLDRVKYDTQRQGVIVTGQPGIGITYSMHTILVSCLYREIPLLVSMDNTTHYLFLDIGVWELCGGLDTLNDSSAAAYRRAIGGKKTPWALFDGDTQEPRGAFTKAYVFWPVLFVPPDLGHYDTWLRQRSPALIVMEPMQTKEILKCCFLLDNAVKRSAQSLNDVLSLISFLGPGTKRCFTYFEKGESRSSQMMEVESTITQFDENLLEKLFTRMTRGKEYSVDISLKPGLRSILLVRPAPKDSGRPFFLTVPSRWVLRRLLERFHTQNWQKRRAFIDMCLRTPGAGSHSMAGDMTEALLHHVIATSPAEWMDRFDDPVLFRARQGKHASTNNPLVTLQHILRRRTLTSYRDRLPGLDAGGYSVYYVPEDPRNPTFDSAFYAPLDWSHEFASPAPKRAPRRITSSSDLAARSTSGPPSSQSAARPFRGPIPNADGTMSGRSSVASTSRSTGRGYSRTPSSLYGTASDLNGAVPPSRSSVSGSVMTVQTAGAKTHAGDTRGRPKSGDGAVPRTGGKRAASAPDFEGLSHKRVKDELATSQTHCIALQFTVSKNHSVSAKGLKLLWNAWPKDAHWSIIYVTTKGRPFEADAMRGVVDRLSTEGKYPYPRASRFNWYYLEVDIDDDDFTDILRSPST